MSKTPLSTLVPHNQSEMSDFAYGLGETAQRYSAEKIYKIFVSELIGDLAASLKTNQIDELANHVERLAKQRAREEKTGKVTHYLHTKPKQDDAEEDDDDQSFMDAYVDFM